MRQSQRFIVSLVLGLGATLVTASTLTKSPINLAEHKNTVATSSTTAQAFTAIADRYEQDYFSRFPEQALTWGRPDAILDRWSDHSLEALDRWHKEEDRYLNELSALDAASLQGSPLQSSLLLLKDTVERSQAARICKSELWQVDPLGGWHVELAKIASKQPVGNAQQRKSALKRWEAIPTFIAAEISLLAVGIQQGFTAPKPAVQRVITQLELMVAGPLTKSPFYDCAARSKDKHFSKQIEKIIATHINPALLSYTTYLKQDYLAKARESVGVAALPAGAACYLAKVRQEATLPLPPQAIHDFGLAHMEALKKEIADIGRKLWKLETISEVFQRAKQESTGVFTSEEQMLAYNFAALERAKKAIFTSFERLPALACTLKPYPLHSAKTGAPGEYSPPAEDGSRPGIYYINTYLPKTRSRIDQEATLFHELIPGHHYQFSLQMETPTGHSFDKYQWNSGFGEGWALYSERLADEMGLYSDDISRLGMLSNEALRTARLVVDPGLHVLGWSRQQAVDYLKKHTALDQGIIEGEVDRYIMLPGQATSYMIGKREIDSLRQLASNKLGTKFKLAEFHTQLFKNGAVTLPMLRLHIETWLHQ